MAASFRSFDKCRGMAGTPLFIAPEILLGLYNHKCDVWSLGVTTFYILTGKMPFVALNEDLLFKKIKNCEIKHNDNWNSLSDAA